MAIPDKIKQLANDIRTKIYGRDVRESLAQGIEEAGSIADDANIRSVATENRQNYLEQRFEQQIQNMTLEDPSSAEIVDARTKSDGTTYPLLKDRLNDFDDKIGILSHFVYVESFPRLNGETDDTARIQRAIDEASIKKATVKFPDIEKVYEVSSELTLKQNVSLDLGKSILKAISVIEAVIGSDDTVRLERPIIKGGKIDCNGLANIGVHIRYFAGLEMESVYVENPKVVHFKLGSSSTSGNSYEAKIYKILGDRQRPIAQPTGSIGLLLENCTDSTIINSHFIGSETGVKLSSGSAGNMFVNVHCWSRRPDNVMNDAFVIESGDNQFIGCIADTPTRYGFHIKKWRNMFISCNLWNSNATGVTAGTVVGFRIDNGLDGSVSKADQISIINSIFDAYSKSQAIGKDVEFEDPTQIYQNNITIIGSVWTYCNTQTTIQPQGLSYPDSTINLDIPFKRNRVNYWITRTEASSNDFVIVERNTDGTWKRDVLRFNRNTGVAKFGGTAIQLTPLTDITKLNGQYNTIFVDTDGKLKYKDSSGIYILNMTPQ